MDLCHNTEFCDQEIISLGDKDDENMFCSFVHQLRRMKRFHYDKFHYQADESTCILSIERNLIRDFIQEIISYSMSLQCISIFAIFQAKFANINNWTRCQFLKRTILLLMDIHLSKTYFRIR